MSRPMEFAIVLGPDDLAHLGVQGLWGVCRVEAGHTESMSFRTRDSALSFADSLPIIPAFPGHPTLTVPFELEVEAIAHLFDALSVQSDPEECAPPISSGPPTGFSEVVPISFGGVVVQATEYGLEISLSGRLVESMGWAEGQRIGLCIDITRTRLAICASESGPRLQQNVEGEFETMYALPLPLGLNFIQPGKQISPPYELHSSAIVFVIPQRNPEDVLARTIPAVPPSPIETAHETRRSFARPLALGAAALLGAALATLSLLTAI